MSEKNIPQRFARLALLLGKEGLARLAEARVFVLGLGGVGSSCAEALARGGVGTLLLLDGDTVEESNINRQALAFVSTVGKSKVEVMQAMIADIDSDCRVETRDVFLTPDNLNEVLSSFPRPDYVVDCIDTVSQKLGIAAWCTGEDPAAFCDGGCQQAGSLVSAFFHRGKNIAMPAVESHATRMSSAGDKKTRGLVFGRASAYLGAQSEYKEGGYARFHELYAACDGSNARG